MELYNRAVSRTPSERKDSTHLESRIQIANYQIQLQRTGGGVNLISIYQVYIDHSLPPLLQVGAS